MITAAELVAQIDGCAAGKVVLALSGGVDSMVLLELLQQARQLRDFQLQAVYINHGLSCDAERWREHCATACADRNITFFSQNISISSTANIEEAAREGRYQALAEFIDSDSTVLMTGHHADDQLETLLLALKRGAGGAGLSGMARQRPFASGYLLRPLLGCSRQQILDFAAEHQLQWVEDSSNNNNRFDRNYIRNVIAPLLNSRWPAFTATTVRSMQHLSQQQQLLRDYTEQASARCCDGNQLDLLALQQHLPLQQDLVIRHWLAQWQLNPSLQWLQTLKQQVIAARQDASPLLVLGRFEVRRYNNSLYLEPPAAATNCRLAWDMQSSLVLPAALGELSVHDVSAPGRLPITRTEVTVVFGQLSLPFKPAEHAQHKPLKQWFKLWQLPPWQRGKVPLLLQHDKLVAVAGYASASSMTQADCWLDWSRN